MKTLLAALAVVVIVGFVIVFYKVSELTQQVATIGDRQDADSLEFNSELQSLTADVYIVSKNLPDSLELFGKFYQLKNTVLGERVADRLNVLIQRPGSLVTLYQRQGRFQPLLDSALATQKGLDDYRYLVAEESWFNTRVYSSVGAAGLAQLRPEAASDQGLLINSHIDERLDPVKAIPAGIRHLKMQCREFDDTLLAVAAYNMGAKNLQDRVDPQGHEDYTFLRLFRETEEYIPNIMAVKIFSLNPNKYVLGISTVRQLSPYPEVKLVKVRLSRKSTLKQLADLAGVDYEDFNFVNPQYLGRVYLPVGDYWVYVIS